MKGELEKDSGAGEGLAWQESQNGATPGLRHLPSPGFSGALWSSWDGVVFTILSCLEVRPPSCHGEECMLVFGLNRLSALETNKKIRAEGLPAVKGVACCPLQRDCCATSNCSRVS